jgi:uncharacterized membrane protein HdeD (DUF308 family)
VDKRFQSIVSGWEIPKGRMSVAAGIAAIILGIVALVFPVLAFAFIEYGFAIYAVIMSAGLVMNGIGLQKENRTHGWLLTIAGIVGIVLGIAILLAPKIMAITAIAVLGIWAVVAGASDLIVVFTSASSTGRGIKAATGLLTLIAGILILAVPKIVDGFLLVMSFGIFAIIIGILTILFGTAKPREEKEVNHLIYK